MKHKIIIAAIIGLISCPIQIMAWQSLMTRPFIYYSNTLSLSLKSVSKSDTATTITFRVPSHSREWSIKPTVHLQANGQNFNYRGGRLLLVKKNGEVSEVPFAPGKTNAYSVATDGKDDYDADSLILRFDPIPNNANTFDFIEGDNSNAWKIWGVRTDGHSFPALLPERRINAKFISAELPSVVPAAGNAILKGKLYGFDQKLGMSCRTLSTNLLTGDQDALMTIDSLGNYQVTAPAFGPLNLLLHTPGHYFRTVISPQYPTTLDIDVRAFTSHQDRSFPDFSKAFSFDGELAPLNAIYNNEPYGLSYENRNNAKTLYVKFSETTNQLYKAMQERRATIKKDKSLTPQQRAFLDLDAQANYVKRYVGYGNEVGLHYRIAIDNKRGQAHAEEDTLLKRRNAEFRLKDKHAAELTLFNDLKALYVVNGTEFLPYMKANGLTASPLYQWSMDLKKAQMLSKRISMMEPVEDKTTWDDISPIYRSTLQAFNDTVTARLKALKNTSSSVHINPTPNATADNMITAIVEKYKGKVVLIDCWATWCGPCKKGIAAMEPLKETMKGLPVVFVYLTGETSDLKSWNKTIPAIPGEHYRIPDNIWDNLPGIKGIPHYFLFDREGKKLMDEEGWSDALLTKFKDNINAAIK